MTAQTRKALRGAQPRTKQEQTTVSVANSISRWALAGRFLLIALACVALSPMVQAKPPFQTPTPTPTPTGTALRFDGVNDFVDLGAGPSFEAHTIEAWVRLSAAPVSDNRNIVGPQGADVNGCFTGANLNLVGGLDGQRFSYNVGRRGCRNDSAIITDPVTAGVWHHLAGTWDGSTMRFYLDGNLVGAQSVSVFDPFDRMLIGAYWDHSSETPVGFFPGDVKEIRLWDHARTECEIREAACQILGGSQPGLIGRWLLNEGAGQTVFDSSASGVNGTLGRNADPAGDSGDPEWVLSEPHGCPALCPTDSDGDGVLDAADQCPNSNLAATVIIDGCDSGAPNVVLPDGCTISDKIGLCAHGAANHGDFTSCVAGLANELRQSGILTGQQQGNIMRCAGSARIP